MKLELKQSISVVEKQIRTQFTSAFGTIYSNDLVPEQFPSHCPPIDLVSVSNPTDLKKIYRGPGFYVIFSDRTVDGNTCRLSQGPLRAIYRGECDKVRKRIESHLFNALYNSNYKGRSDSYVAKPENKGRAFYEAHWPHCIKLDLGGPSGINIDQSPYCDHKWYVLVHRMDESTQQVRKIAELAFDDAFGHPAASREVRSSV